MSLALKVARTLALGIPHIARDIAPALGGKVAVDSGAILRAIIAPSISIVPDPHMGS